MDFVTTSTVDFESPRINTIAGLKCMVCSRCMEQQIINSLIIIQNIQNKQVNKKHKSWFRNYDQINKFIPQYSGIKLIVINTNFPCCFPFLFPVGCKKPWYGVLKLTSCIENKLSNGLKKHPLCLCLSAHPAQKITKFVGMILFLANLII